MRRLECVSTQVDETEIDVWLADIQDDPAVRGNATRLSSRQSRLTEHDPEELGQEG